MLRFDLFISRLGFFLFGVALMITGMESCKTTGLTDEQQLQQLNKMEWISGTWQNLEGDLILREEWKRENDTLYSAKSFMIMSGDTVFQEQISILPGKRHIYYNVSMVVNDKPQYASFVLKKNSSGAFIFEDLQNIDLSRISYSKKGKDQILVKTEGKEEGKSVKEEYLLKRIP